MHLSAALYVHFPFCLKRCAYCDFHTVKDPGLDFRKRYYEALIHDIRETSRDFPLKIKSVFFGGGTPTLTPPDYLEAILQCIAQNFRLETNCEITTEANPGTVTRKSLAFLRRAGFNRLSLGVQSLDDNILRTMGRAHTAGQAFDVLHQAREEGFDNINADIIYGYPGASLESCRKTLSEVIESDVKHVSCYALSVEEGTPLGRAVASGMVTLPSEYEVLTIERALARMMQEAGFIHYEISNWCKPGFSCRHNKAYWKNEPSLGLGSGAVSFYGGWRFRRISDIERYICACEDGISLIESAERLGADNAFKEAMILALRMKRGFSVGMVRKFGANPAAIAHFFRNFPGLVHIGKTIRLTGRGRSISNEIFVRLMETRFI